MKILYFDCFSGISGDMTIGALLDLGLDAERFRQELAKLNLDGYELRINRKLNRGISGTDIDVVLTEDDTDHDHHHEHEHDHQHDNHHHGHDHGHDDPHDHHGHPHDDDGHHHDHEDRRHSHEDHDHGHHHDHHGTERNLADIMSIIDGSSLSGRIKDFSRRVFTEIAAAEAKVHGKPINEVHFHEVGAVDSIVDIAGTAICLELLGIDRVYSSPLHDGSGFIECRHGIIPVPVPAVVEMLSGSGIPLITEDVGTELVTPTGMGIIKCLAESFGGRPAMTVDRTGYGLGKRETGRLNALRVIMGELYEEAEPLGTSNNQNAVKSSQGKADNLQKGDGIFPPCSPKSSDGDEIVVLETNIDDSSPEIIGYTSERLFENGALDVFYTPIYMKKNRPAYMLTVLARREDEEKLAGIILTETSTLGIRKSIWDRYCMDRATVNVTTPYGGARVKIASRGSFRKAAPEYEDCKKLAASSGLPISKIYETVMENARKQHGV